MQARKPCFPARAPATRCELGGGLKFTVRQRAPATAGETPATLLTELWPADRPHLPVAEVAEWFATYVYLPKLRDRVALETAIRDALAELDPKFAHADGFDESSGKYVGLLWQGGADRPDAAGRAPGTAGGCDCAAARY